MFRSLSLITIFAYAPTVVGDVFPKKNPLLRPPPGSRGSGFSPGGAWEERRTAIRLRWEKWLRENGDTFDRGLKYKAGVDEGFPFGLFDGFFQWEIPGKGPWPESPLKR